MEERCVNDNSEVFDSTHDAEASQKTDTEAEVLDGLICIDKEVLANKTSLCLATKDQNESERDSFKNV